MTTPSRRTTPLPRGWQALRQRILERDQHTCQTCGTSGANHVDHIVPASQGGTDAPGNLQALCRRCHDAKTGREARAARARQEGSRRRPREPHPGLHHAP